MKNKKGKKLVVLGAMAALLTLIGVSGSQTYAKYVESKEVAGNNATVAKWGFTLDAQVGNLFGKMHETTATSTSVVTTYGSSVVAHAEGNIVAPGTKGEMTFSVIGAAEVDAIISVDFTNVQDISLTADGVAYSPLKWSLSEKINDGVSRNDSDYQTVVLPNKSLSDVASYFSADFSYDLEANYKEISREYKLSYEWAYHVDDETDDKDTAFAKMVAQNVTSLTYKGVNYELVQKSATFDFELTVTQAQLNA